MVLIFFLLLPNKKIQQPEIFRKVAINSLTQFVKLRYIAKNRVWSYSTLNQLFLFFSFFLYFFIKIPSKCFVSLFFKKKIGQDISKKL
jgi:predicted CDP-diglyceride synthetase/phosphatidate cytidylyltransferase